MAPALVAILVPSTVLLTLAIVAWPIALAILPFILYAALAPWVMRAKIDRLGAVARDRLGLLSAYVTETIQGLSDLVAFQAVGRRRARLHGGGRRAIRKSGCDCSAICRRRPRSSRSCTGLGGLAVAIVGALLVAGGPARRDHPAAC